MREFSCVLRRSTNQAISNASPYNYPLSWDTVVRNEGGLFNISSPTKIVVPSGADGLYNLSASCYWQQGGGGRRDIAFRLKRGTDTFFLATHRITAFDYMYYNATSAMYVLEAGDEVEVTVFQDSTSSTLNVISNQTNGQSTSPVFAAVHLGK